MQDTGSGGSWPISTDRVVWFLGANSLLAPALHLYEAAGFHRITRDELPVANYYARADILMEKSLE